MDASVNQLHGSCACERNQYVIHIPRGASGQAHVFLDNSAAARRPQAAPITAWLRVPLAWYHSATLAAEPDETHASIRRSYYTLPPRSIPSGSDDRPTADANTVAAGSPTRRQFCGYCGTHLTAWNEGRGPGAADLLDVTLGSLARDSLKVLAELDLISDDEDEQDADEAGRERNLYGSHVDDVAGRSEGLVKGGSVVDEVHVPSRPAAATTEGLVKGGSVVEEDHVSATSGLSEGRTGARDLQESIPTHPGLVKGGTVVDEDHISAADGPAGSHTTVEDTGRSMATTTDSTPQLVKGGIVDNADHIATNETTAGDVNPPSKSDVAPRQSLHILQHRGIPYFEDLVQDSQLGRIRRRAGRFTSKDGRYTHEWEITEIGSGGLEGDEAASEAPSIDDSPAAGLLGAAVPPNKRRRMSP